MAQFQASRPQSTCMVCGKPILVRSTKGKRSTGYCSRVCASMSRYGKRYTGPRSEIYNQPVDLEKKRKE